MKKKSRLVAMSAVCVVLLALVCGCGGSKLSGRYDKESNGYAPFDYLEFFSDGKYTSNRTNYEGDYSAEGNRLRLEGILVDSMVFYYKVEGDILTLSAHDDFDDAFVYKKK